MNRALPIALCTVAILCVAGCATPPAAGPLTPPAAAAPLNYEYVAQVLAMPSCHATVEATAACYACFKTDDGRQLCIGSPGCAPEVLGFVQTLEKGNACFLPDAFMDYLKSQREKPNKPDAADGR